MGKICNGFSEGPTELARTSELIPSLFGSVIPDPRTQAEPLQVLRRKLGTELPNQRRTWPKDRYADHCGRTRKARDQGWGKRVVWSVFNTKLSLLRSLMQGIRMLCSSRSAFGSSRRFADLKLLMKNVADTCPGIGLCSALGRP
jgi:hypothetical protein